MSEKNILANLGGSNSASFESLYIISGAKQLLWTGRVSDVHRRNKNISCAIQQLRFLSSITQKHMTFHLVKKCFVFL